MRITHIYISTAIISLLISGLDSSRCPPGLTRYISDDGLNTTSCLACKLCSKALVDYLFEVDQNLQHAKDTIDPDNSSEKMIAKLNDMNNTLNEHSIGLQTSQTILDNAKSYLNTLTDHTMSIVAQLERETEELESLIIESKFVENTLELTSELLEYLNHEIVRKIDHDKITDVTLNAMLDMRQSIELLYRKVVDTRSRTNQNTNATSCV